jgi:hypothetical protein
MYDTAPGHLDALLAPFVGIPIAWLILRRLPGYRSAGPILKAAALLMLVTGFVHLGLVPAHLASKPVTSMLFVIDGLGFLGLAVAAFTTTWWRRPAILWLTATILAYVVWAIAGWETPDQIGIACKLVELVALGLVLRLGTYRRNTLPHRVWRAVALPLTTSVTMLGIFIGGLAHPDALHAHAGAILQPAYAIATPQQQVATARLLAETRASLARYQDPQVAIAAGFTPGLKSDAESLQHWANKANAGVILDPSRPQDLVYVPTHHGLVLVGAMFQMPKIGQWGPDPGGPLTQWHQHEGICFSPFGIEFSFATPAWGCPVGSISVTVPPMLHVWIVDNPKGGPFSADLDPRMLRALESR